MFLTYIAYFIRRASVLASFIYFNITFSPLICSKTILYCLTEEAPLEVGAKDTAYHFFGGMENTVGIETKGITRGGQWVGLELGFVWTV